MTAASSEAEVLDMIPIAAAVITSGTAAEPAGFTGSVWGEPRNPGWLAVPVSAESSTLPIAEATGRVGVNVLGAHGRPLVAAFTKRVERSAQRFCGVEWTFRDGVPVLNDGIAWFACALDAVVPFGTYRMMMCRIEHSEIRSRHSPLVWVNGRGVPAGEPTTEALR